MAFVKALIPAMLLTWIVSSIMGSNGSHGGMLAIGRTMVQGHGFYWSWPLFLASLLLAWAIFAMMD